MGDARPQSEYVERVPVTRDIDDRGTREGRTGEATARSNPEAAQRGKGGKLATSLLHRLIYRRQIRVREDCEGPTLHRHFPYADSVRRTPFFATMTYVSSPASTINRQRVIAMAKQRHGHVV